MDSCVRGYHLPGGAERVAMQRIRVGLVDVDVPCLDAPQLRAAMDAARDTAARHLAARSQDDILATIDRVVTNWLRPEYPLRQLAERMLPKATGFSAAMVAHGLPLLLQPLRAPAIRLLLDAELGDRRGPASIIHVLSGNIPGLAATPIMLSLALGWAVLVKSAAGDPIFPALFADSISEVDEMLGGCVAVTHWRGGDRSVEEVAFAAADLVVASGSDAAIAAIAPRVPCRFIGYGHKVSFAAIGAECLDDAESARELAQRLAYDVSLWDQQGCLSPQLCYIESHARVAPTRFAELLADSLAAYCQELPPRQLSFEEQAAVLRFRQSAEWASNAAVALLASPGTTDWSISLEPEVTFLPTCLNRCIRLAVVDDLQNLAAVLTPHRLLLEAAGVAAGPERAAAIDEMLIRCGVHRICPIGTMQLPPLSWRQGGRPRVGDWIPSSATGVRQHPLSHITRGRGPG